MESRRRPRIPRKAQKARSGKYKFSVKTHPIKGIVSCIFAVISIIVLVISCYLAWQSRGNVEAIVGLANVLSFVIAIAGLVMAVTSTKEKEIHMLFPMLGGTFCGILTIAYLMIYITGTLL